MLIVGLVGNFYHKWCTFSFVWVAIWRCRSFLNLNFFSHKVHGKRIGFSKWSFLKVICNERFGQVCFLAAGNRSRSVVLWRVFRCCRRFEVSQNVRWQIVHRCLGRLPWVRQMWLERLHGFLKILRQIFKKMRDVTIFLIGRNIYEMVFILTGHLTWTSGSWVKTWRASGYRHLKIFGQKVHVTPL